MKNTSSETKIQDEFFKAWEGPFKCDACEFSKLYKNTRELFCQREERYRNILEKIAEMANPGLGLEGHNYEYLLQMLESCLDNSGDKAKLKAEVRRLTQENEQMALEIIRNR